MNYMLNRAREKAKALAEFLEAFDNPGWNVESKAEGVDDRYEHQAHLDQWMCYIARLCAEEIKMDLDDVIKAEEEYGKET